MPGSPETTYEMGEKEGKRHQEPVNTKGSRKQDRARENSTDSAADAAARSAQILCNGDITDYVVSWAWEGSPKV